jgi:transcription elongation factor Elf1
MHQCEAALANLSSSFHAVTARDFECPGCAARGASILGDEGGRFVTCFVCGSSVLYSSPYSLSRL